MPDERFERVMKELRAGKPSAPPDLRRRVRGVVSEARPRPRWLAPRPVAVALAAAAVVALAGYAAVRETGGSSSSRRASSGPAVGVAQQKSSTQSPKPSGSGFEQAAAQVARIHVANLRVGARRTVDLIRANGGTVGAPAFPPPGIVILEASVPSARAGAFLAELSSIGRVVVNRPMREALPLRGTYSVEIELVAPR